MKLNKIAMFALITMLASCGNRKVKIADMSPTPIMSITDLKGNPIVRDSIKMTLKTSNKKYSSFIINLVGNSGKTNLKVTTINTSGSVLVDGKSGDIDITSGIHTVNYTPQNITGTSLIVLEAKDEYEKYSTGKIEIITFENLDPVGSMKVTPSGVFSSREYILDASGSYDRDSKYGGTIISYIFTINGKSFETVDGSPTASWIFGGPGKYNISVTVKDNDNETSTYILPEPFDVQ